MYLIPALGKMMEPQDCERLVLRRVKSSQQRINCEDLMDMDVVVVEEE